MHILLVRTSRLLRHQGVIGPPIGQRRIQIFPVHITGERSGLADQPTDDVPIVDLMLGLAPQTRHPLQQLLGIPHLDLLHAYPHFDLLTDQARWYRVGVLFHPNGAATPYPHPLSFQRLQALSRQGAQLYHLRRKLHCPAGIPLGLDGLHQVPIVRARAEIPAAA
jgi:hypothetical protein